VSQIHNLGDKSSLEHNDGEIGVHYYMAWLKDVACMSSWMLFNVCYAWCNDGAIVSFRLGTDERLLPLMQIDRWWQIVKAN
jgi:hypothetical protein